MRAIEAMKFIYCGSIVYDVWGMSLTSTVKNWSVWVVLTNKVEIQLIFSQLWIQKGRECTCMYVVCMYHSQLSHPHKFFEIYQSMSNKWCLITSDILNLWQEIWELCRALQIYVVCTLPGSLHILAMNFPFLRRLLILVGKTVKILFDMYEKYFCT